MLRYLITFCIAVSSQAAHAQIVQGSFGQPPVGGKVILHDTRGTEHPVLDTAIIDRKGNFTFVDRRYPPGFYQLSVNDSDRVDIILDPSEPVVEFRFGGSPMQSDVQVLRSSENQRMWTYKRLSRNAQPELLEIRSKREGADPQDLALIKELASREQAITASLEFSLDSLIAVYPEGQFAYAVGTDRELDGAILDGPIGIRRAFDFSNPRYLRSSSYPKAVMVYLQNTPWTSDMALQYACDTLLDAAKSDTACWGYMRIYLVELFTTYGPADLAQYLVDEYVVGPGSRFPPEDRLLDLAAEQMRLVNGAPAPEVYLITPGARDTTRLSDIIRQHDYTALFFYSSTCDHCHDQMPGLHRIVMEVPSKKFQLIGIALDIDVAEFRQAIIDHGINWPCYSHLIGWGEPAAKDFAVKATPALFLIDRAGRIVGKPTDHEQLREMLER